MLKYEMLRYWDVEILGCWDAGMLRYCNVEIRNVEILGC